MSSKPVWLGLEQGACFPNPSVLGRLTRHRVLESIPGACGHWVVTRAGTLSEEQLHVLGHTTAAFCCLVNSGPGLNAECCWLDGVWNNLG